ncbi:MAG: glycosyltransferase family 4 protein [bacterium]|nr:glycosyltransferase family 4 protein [bacterium]
MKILFINNDKGWGGGQEFLLQLAKELRGNGCEIHFVVRGGSPSELRFGELGFTIHPAFHTLKTFINLAAIMRREYFDIVSINREHDIPLTVISRFMAFPFSPFGKVTMNYHIPVARRQYFLGVMNAIVCVSNHIRETVLQSDPSLADKTLVIPNGIKISFPVTEEKFTSTRQRRYFKDSSFPLIGMVGAFWKNQIELIECIPALRDKFPNIKIVFVGDNTEVPLVTPLIDKIQELQVESQVIFTGKVPREDISNIFFDLDLSVSTHRNEGFGLVHLESLSTGTPVVCYNEGGQIDIFDGTGAGVLVDGGPSEFVSEVISLLKDHQRRFDMGRTGVELVRKRFSVEVMTARYVEFFFNISGKQIKPAI